LIIPAENQLRQYGGQLFAVLIPPLEVSEHRFVVTLLLTDADPGPFYAPRVQSLGQRHLFARALNGMFSDYILTLSSNALSNFPTQMVTTWCNLFYSLVSLDLSQYIHFAGNMDGIGAIRLQ
jgi:hypothetical protein